VKSEASKYLELGMWVKKEKRKVKSTNTWSWYVGGE